MLKCFWNIYPAEECLTDGHPCRDTAVPPEADAFVVVRYPGSQVEKRGR